MSESVSHSLLLELRAAAYDELQRTDPNLTRNRALAQGRLDMIDELVQRSAPKPPAQEYYVLYKVRWQPDFEGQNPPMDRDHEFGCTDERSFNHEMIAIGDDDVIAQYLQEEVHATGGEAHWYVGPEESGV